MNCTGSPDAAARYQPNVDLAKSRQFIPLTKDLAGYSAGNMFLPTTRDRRKVGVKLLRVDSMRRRG
jgi:hypothetical protein